MNITEYLKDEIKRLNRINDLLEKEVNKSTYSNVITYEIIQKNTLAICEVAKVYLNF